MVELLRAAGLNPELPAERLTGGDISQVWRCGEGVVKLLPTAPGDFFDVEARGLRLLHRGGARVPEVVHVEERGLVMRYLAPGPPDPDALAAMLCRLHTPLDLPYGSEAPIYLGRLCLPTVTSTDWTRLFIEHRLYPLIETGDRHLGPLRSALDRYLDRLELPVEGSCIVHGDLWSGNVLHSVAGPALIDPSAQVGERGLDLAMMALFGGFSRQVWEGIEHRRRLSPEVRHAIGPQGAYRLYFLLAHVAMFGAGWVSGVREVIEA